MRHGNLKPFTSAYLTNKNFHMLFQLAVLFKVFPNLAVLFRVLLRPPLVQGPMLERFGSLVNNVACPFFLPIFFNLPPYLSSAAWG